MENYFYHREAVIEQIKKLGGNIIARNNDNHKQLPVLLIDELDGTFKLKLNNSSQQEITLTMEGSDQNELWANQFYRSFISFLYRNNVDEDDFFAKVSNINLKSQSDEGAITAATTPSQQRASITIKFDPKNSSDDNHMSIARTFQVELDKILQKENIVQNKLRPTIKDFDESTNDLITENFHKATQDFFNEHNLNLERFVTKVATTNSRETVKKRYKKEFVITPVNDHSSVGGELIKITDRTDVEGELMGEFRLDPRQLTSPQATQNVIKGVWAQVYKDYPELFDYDFRQLINVDHNNVASADDVTANVLQTTEEFFRKYNLDLAATMKRVKQGEFKINVSKNNQDQPDLTLFGENGEWLGEFNIDPDTIDESLPKLWERAYQEHQDFFEAI